MRRLQDIANNLEGVEFDWLAFDRNGAAAVFMTAGCGEVPNSILAVVGEVSRAGMDKSLDLILDSWEETSTYTEEGGGVGVDRETPRFARRGLVVYDWGHWQGPYRRVLVPSTPAKAKRILDLMPTEIRSALPVLEIDFFSTTCFQLSDVIPCHTLRS